MIENYLAMCGINIMAMSILGYMVYRNDLFDQKTRRHFLYAIMSIVVVIFAEMGTAYLAYPTETSRTWLTLFSVIGFSVSPFVPIVIALVFGSQSRVRRIIFSLPVFINLILTILSPVHGFIFRVLPDGSYFRGQWFILFIISYASSMIYLLIETMRAVRIYQNRNGTTLYWLFLLFLVGTLIQLVFPSVHTTWTSVSIAMIMYYAHYCDLLEKHDVLTNLLNRRSYEYHLPHLDIKGIASIIMLDVDDFKETNDKYGHQFGDECLRVIAGNIRASFSKIGTCYRIGGDEFCVLIEHTDESILQGAEASFQKRMEEDRGQDQRLPCLSFGHAVYDDPREGIKQAVDEADRRMYFHKHQQKQQQLQIQSEIMDNG
jgi:diguanylate cyclase (GGDEF)-like protein